MYAFIKFVECCHLLCTGVSLHRRIDTLELSVLVGIAPAFDEYHAHGVLGTIASVELSVHVDNVHDVVVGVEIAKELGILRVEASIVPVRVVTTDDDCGLSVVLHVVEGVDYYLSLQTGDVVSSIIEAAHGGCSEWWVGEHGIYLLGCKGQQTVL